MHVVDPDIRREQIALRVDEALKKHSVRKEYKFRDGEELPVISLPIDHLVYRLENYRTKDKQLSLIARGVVPKDFFDKSRREDPSVQAKQHEILLQQAKSGSGETIKAIYDELGKTGKQTEDLIISSDGVVVNGNRRLCSMRSLLNEDSKAYKNFENVLCAVLPPSATETEILDLEIGLQMEPETKLPYEWTALGRAVRDLRAAGKDDDVIARQMKRTKPEIVRAAKMIDLAEMYLSDWLGDPDDFDKLAGTEQAFIQIAVKNLGKTDDPPLREVTRNFDFFIVEHRGQISDRAYKLINTIEDNPTTFLSTVSAELGIDVSEVPSQVADQPDISFDEPVPQVAEFGRLTLALTAARGDADAAAVTIGAIESVCDTVAEQGKNRDKAAEKFAKRAEKALSSIDLQSAAPTTYAAIDSAMARCLELAQKVREGVAQRQKKG